VEPSRLSCGACDKSFTLDREDDVVAQAELESFVSAHAYCGGALSFEIRSLSREIQLPADAE
jgi:hypothetical protein